MADGFKANAIFFKPEYPDKNSIAMGESFKEILSLLWLKAGGIGKCPDVEEVPPYLILPENKFAVLIDEKHFKEFAKAISDAAINPYAVSNDNVREAGLLKDRIIIIYPDEKSSGDK